jgi:hypothetical protein
MVLLIMAIAQAGSGETAGDAPVARVGERIIRYREIACDQNVPNLQEIAAKEQRDPIVLCREREQQRLQLLAVRELVDAAIRKRGIEPTADEMAKDAAFHHYDEAEFTRLSERYRGLARAALRVFRGEQFDAVYAQNVQPTGMPQNEFRHFVDVLGNADAAERFIVRHTPEHFRTSILTDARRRLGRARLTQTLKDEATRRGVPFQSYAQTFWRELAAAVGLEVMDHRYQPISLEELSWTRNT